MKYKFLLPVLLLLSACTATEKSEFQTCKMFIGVSDPKQNDEIHRFVQARFVDTNISGYTIYAAEGGWRPTQNVAYMTEPTVVLEVIVKNAEVPHIHQLVLELEQQLKQTEIIYYCHSVNINAQ